MKRIIVSFLLVSLFSPLQAQKRAFTIADLFAIRNVDDPQYSPDGKKIAFVVREDKLETGTSKSDIYLMNADGSGTRALTTGRANDTHPRWSPDGKSLLFLSTRSEGAQAWVLPLDGGEPKQLTGFFGGIAQPEWLPDGSGIVFTGDVYPECGADSGCNKKTEETWGGGPLHAHMTDGLLYRHWTSWKDGKRTHTFVYRGAESIYTDLTPGDFDSPSFSLGGEAGFAVSPDGKEICFVSQRDGREAETTNKDLWVVPIGGGVPVNLTEANAACDGDPAYSPDGRYIAYRTQTVPGYESDRFRIALYDRTTKVKRILTEGFDNWVDAIAWGPDSRHIYFTSDVKGHVPLYSVDIGTEEIASVIDPKTVESFALSADGKKVAFVRRTVGEPRDIWEAETAGRSVRRLTFCNKKIEDEVDIRPAEEMWISSPTGSRIHTFIIKPHNFDPAKKYPLILNVHGGPQSQWQDAFRGDWQVYPGCGYIVALPNPHGSTGYGQAFTESISKDWNGKPFEDVMAVADSLSKLPYVDSGRMGAMGWSYGGYMMMWLEGHTTRFKAIASMMGVYDLTAMHGGTEELWFPEFDLGGTPWTSDLYDRLSPNKSVKAFATPCLVITGERDYRVPYTQSLEFYTDLQEMHVPSRLIVFNDDGHWPNGITSMPFYYNAHLDWFHTYLGGDPAPYDMTKMLRNQVFGGK